MIFAIPFFFVIPFVSYLLLFTGVFSKTSNHVGDTFVILLTIILFYWVGNNFITNQANDLSRYLLIVKEYSFYTPEYFYSNLVQTGKISEIVQQSLFFIASRFSNPQVLSGITTSVTYGVAVWILQTGKNKYKVPYGSMVLGGLLMFSELRVDVAAGNVRNITAAALVMIGILGYQYYRKGIIFQLFFFALGVSMHVGVLPVIFMKLTADYLTTWKQRRLLSVLGMSLILIIGIIITIKLGIIDTAFGKLGEYSGDGAVATSAWFNSLDNSLRFRVYKFAIIVLNVFLFLINFVNYRNSRNNVALKMFIAMLIIFTSVFALMQPGSTFLRFFYFEVFITPLVLFEAAEYKKNNFVNLMQAGLMFIFFYYQWYYIQTNVDAGAFFRNTFLIPIWAH